MRALAIVRRDLLRLARNPGRTALLFALPLVMAGIFTLVFGGEGPSEVTVRVLVFDEDDSLLSRLLGGASSSPEAAGNLDLVAVGEEGFEMMERGEASALVHIPAGFTDDYLSGRPAAITVVKNPSQRFLPKVVEEGAGILAVGLSQTSVVFRAELDQLHALMSDSDFPEDAAVAAMGAGVNAKLRELERFLLPPVITLGSTTAADDDAGPGFSVLEIVLPGLAVMGILFLAQAATRDILRDRESGLLAHLLTSPVSVADYVLGKGLSVLLITFAGFVVLVAVGIAAGVDWGHAPAVAALVLATAIGASGTLLLIMSAVGSERSGDALTTIVIISWSMLGGAFVPLSQLPDFLRPVSATTLVYWATDGFNRLITDDAGLAAVVPNIVVLAGAGLLFMAAGSVVLHRRISRGA